MKVGTILMLLLSYVFCCILPHAAAQEEIIAYNGASYPDFSVVKNGRIFCTADENYGDVFLSRKVLYSIDLNNMSAEKVFSVRNAYSEIFVDSDTIYFTYPKSWFSSHLVYGDHTWYSSSISDAEKKKNWNKMCENNSKTDRWMRYFQTIDGVYGYVRPDGEYGSCELGKYEDEKYCLLYTSDAADE